MHLDGIVHQVQQQLTAAAALGDDRVREVAAALTAAASPAIQLAVMSALSAAADEITTALLDAPGSPAVAVRLDADEVRVEVSMPPPQPQPAQRGEDGEATARISLRLSDALKAEVEAAAARQHVSVNTWLVQAAALALSTQSAQSTPGPTGWPPAHASSHRVTGWIDG
jgi:hypothetical protein